MNPMNCTRGTLIGVALLVNATLIGGSAIAADQGQETVRTVNVHYQQSDLADTEGAKSLYWRIQKAARHVCGESPTGELAQRTLFQKCYNRAVDEAVAKIDATALTVLHRSKTQRSAAG